MRIITTTLSLALAVLLTSSAWAEEGSGKKGDRPSREEMRKKMLEKFDADGDGKLNESERAEAGKEMRKRMGERGFRGKGGPGDRGPRERGPEGRKGSEGRRGPEGRPGPEGRRGSEGRGGPGRDGPPNPGQMFDRFDANNDNQLSREEFMKMARAVREMRERRGPGGPPPRGDFGQRGPRGPRADGPPPRRRPGGDGPPERRRGPRPDKNTSITEIETDGVA